MPACAPASAHEGLSRPVQVIVPRGGGCPGAASTCRCCDDGGARAAPGRDPGGRIAPSASIWPAPPLMRFALIRLAADEHRLVLTNHHLLMDGWSMPVLVQELLTLYAHKGDAARPAAGDALPRLSGVARRGRTAPPRSRPGGRPWPGWRSPRVLAPPDRRERLPVAPEQITLALSETLTAALTRQARAARPDAQHPHAGGVGDAAGAADRARRRGVRRDGGGPAAGDCRHRAHGGAVHQHAAAAGAAAGRQAADRVAAARCRTASRG